MWQTIGIWIGALLTLCIYSFLYKDNPFYKFAEHLFVGVSAGYGVAITWYQVLVPYLINPLFRGIEQADGTMVHRWWLIVPMIVGLLYLTRFFQQVSWLSRWPISLAIGTGAGYAITSEMQANVIRQLHASMVSLDPNHLLNEIAVTSGAEPIYLGIGGVINNIVILIGILSVLSYFFFSLKHVGALGFSAKLGIWFLMVTFGAAFGYTVMARISLLIGRMQFLLGDWLGIVSSQ